MRTVQQDDIAGADIKAMCTEAGLLALRERRMKVAFTHQLCVTRLQQFMIGPCDR